MNKKGIKILNKLSKYSIWVIEEDCNYYYKIAYSRDRSIITTINKNKVYEIEKDIDYLYSDMIINTKSSFNFAFYNFGTIILE